VAKEGEATREEKKVQCGLKSSKPDRENHPTVGDTETRRLKELWAASKKKSRREVRGNGREAGEHLTPRRERK